MKGYLDNIDEFALENENFRKVIHTTKNSQLVLMSLSSQEEIGEEVLGSDQFIRCVLGQGKVVLGGVNHSITEGVVVLVPAGTSHNIINTSLGGSLKIYTLYSPPGHRDGTIHPTKADAKIGESESFDGKTTE